MGDLFQLDVGELDSEDAEGTGSELWLLGVGVLSCERCQTLGSAARVVLT
jgi:hypothetical protein